MPVRLPELNWPVELLETGPDEDPSILLSGATEIGTAPHRVLAIRVNPSHVQVDFRANLDEAVYADYQLGVMLEELNVFDNVDRSAVVPLESGNYVIWMVPSADD
jgi:hypothetical protein